MEENNFFEQLCAQLELPFSINDVQSIESNCGTIWIELSDGKTFSVIIQPCEIDNTE